MKYLIIGSKGFIGENLKKHLEKNVGTTVWGADVVVDYVDNEKYFLIDASNSDYKSIFETEHFDVCINCSGAASVPDSILHPLRDYQLNTVNVFKMLDAIRTYQPKCKFINLSSAAVYGNPGLLPIKEDALVIPLSPYGIHKLQSEQICSEFFRFFEIATCSLRIFSAYGEGLKKQLFWDLYRKTKDQKQIDLFGSGRESRDFIYILDLVNAIELVANKADFCGETINIANGEEVFIEDCVASFYNNFDDTISYSFSGQGRAGDPNNWIADISILKSLGYERKYNLEKGLENYYRWILETEKK
ncbi:NAD(P)-dependent oxidoreductase [Flavobacterium sp. LC2016-12]|uniref:NAD-dependent epimerase/dehydratase family protein n=1 Tax=Flavobacterium sp. LC2016-12 TaxID=2783794 RepID=UPI00188CFDA1|nr:SDR family oxidoreductase [Flavobacterium sp. LC2016-12]MBF4465672.1 SDR family oxidoreductase [Flavobacterium sp. LC2016-12]